MSSRVSYKEIYEAFKLLRIIRSTDFVVSQGDSFDKPSPNITYKDVLDIPLIIHAAFRALTIKEWEKFTTVIAKTNYCYYLIALTMFYGSIGHSDVLSLTIDQVDTGLNIIKFRRKTQTNRIKEHAIKFPPLFIHALTKYIDETQSKRGKKMRLFITDKGKMITLSKLENALAQASKDAHIKPVSPRIIMATGIVLRQRLPKFTIISTINNYQIWRDVFY